MSFNCLATKNKLADAEKRYKEAKKRHRVTKKKLKKRRAESSNRKRVAELEMDLARLRHTMELESQVFGKVNPGWNYGSGTSLPLGAQQRDIHTAELTRYSPDKARSNTGRSLLREVVSISFLIF